MNVELPVLCIAKPTEGDGYLVVALDLLQGVEALSKFQNISPRGCALLAAHALECALKAFLWHKGKRKEIRNSKVRHNLTALWAMAYKEGLDIPKKPPDWCEILSTGHGPNFYFRYQEGEKEGKEKNIVHCGQTPALIPMTIELKKLIEDVNLAVRS